MKPNRIAATNLRTIRESVKMSRKELAEASGLSTSRIQALEGGKGRSTGMTPDDMIAICSALDISAFELLLPPDGTTQIEVDRGGHRSPTVPVDWYSEVLFRSLASKLNPDSIKLMHESMVREWVRDWILSQHPDVRSRVEQQEELMRRPAAVLIVALEAAGHGGTGGLSIDAGLSDAAARVRAKLHGIEGVEIPTLEQAWEGVATAHRRIDGVRSGWVEEIAHRIADGELSEPRLPDDPVELREIHQDPERIRRLADEWLATIEQETN